MSRYVSPEKEISISLRLSKVPNSQSNIGSITTYSVWDLQDRQAQASILFQFIFIVGLTFPDRIPSSKMWFFFGIGDVGRAFFQPFEQKWFQWLNLFNIFQFFWLSNLFCGHWAIPDKKKTGKEGGKGTGWGHNFLKKPWKFSFFFWLYRKKFQTKQSSAPGNSTKLW